MAVIGDNDCIDRMVDFMSTVDLSKAKSGDVVHFRCGGSANIINMYDNYISNTKCYFIGFGLDFGSEIPYEKNGEVCGISPTFDIVKVESK